MCSQLRLQDCGLQAGPGALVALVLRSCGGLRVVGFQAHDGWWCVGVCLGCTQDSINEIPL